MSRVTHGCFLAVPVPTSAGTGSRGYGYGWTQIYPWVIRDEPYACRACKHTHIRCVSCSALIFYVFIKFILLITTLLQDFIAVLCMPCTRTHPNQVCSLFS